MALLPKLLRAALCSEKTLLVSSSRCMSGHHCRLQSLSINLKGNDRRHDWFQKCVPQNTISNPSSTTIPIVNSVLQRIDVAILPMSPVERLIKLQLPTISKDLCLEMPTTKASLDNAHINRKIGEMQAPQRGRIIKQLAIRMLVIRRRKMKKHQRKKFLKKWRVHLMTKAQKRFVIKETAFLSGLEQELKSGEAFNAEEFVADKIRRAYKPLPEKEEQVRPLPWEFRPLFHYSKRNGK